MKIKSKRIFITLVVVLLSQSLTIAQNQNLLTLEQIYRDNEFKLNDFGPAIWLEDGSGYTTLEKSIDFPDSKDIIKYNPETDDREILINAKQLIPENEDTPLLITDYKWSKNGDKLLIFTNTERVWRYNTRGDYWVLNIKTNKLFQIGQFANPSTMMFAKFSPNGKMVGYVVENNIYVEDLNLQKITQITHDGSSRIINGTFDWVYEEELDCRDGFRWSPDSKKIAYWQSDTEGTGVFYLINNIDSLYSKPIPFPYPKVGTTNSAVKVGVVSIKGGSTNWFNTPGDPRNNYIARMDFIPNSNEVIIQQLNRLQNQNTVYVGNVNSMSLTNILTDIDEAWLDIHDNIQWLDNDKYFTWTSERDGWRHLYKVSKNGETIESITKGEFDVIKINCIDESGGYVYYIASQNDYSERYLYRSRIDGKGSSERISPTIVNGQYAYQMSPNAKWAITTFQNTTNPNIVTVTSLPDHNIITTLEDNTDIKNKYNDFGLSPKEFIEIDIGEELLYGWIMKPANFDETQKYPLIFYIYGEPWNSTVQNRWTNRNIWHQYLAQQGYIIMSVDNRGTNVPRGRDWRKSIYRQVGILAAHDQAKAAKEIFKMFPFIDTERVGMWGWSGGGQMTMNCMFRHPDIYKTGIAVSFVSDQRLYDTIYQERYMGLLDDNTDGYYNGSPINHAYKLDGNLMIIHGTADDNVHYQSFEMLVDELIRHNKLFSMMSYPMRSHGLSERENTSLHLRRTMEDYWVKNLSPGGKKNIIKKSN